MGVSFYPINSLPFKLKKKGMNFLLSPLKFLNKGREKYYKNIILISFHSLFPNKELVTNQISPRIFKRSKH